MRILGALTLIFLSAAVHAQIRYGLKTGVNFSDVVINNVISPDAESDFQMKAGLVAGAFFIAEGTNNIGLSAEVLYSNKGVHAVDNNIRLHYLAIPMFLRYRLSDKFVAEAGPEIAYLIDANSVDGNLNATWDNKLDIGLDAGLQLELGKISLGTRFNAGFSSVIRHANDPLTGNHLRYQNRVLQFFVALNMGELK